VTVGKSQGRGFTGLHGDGELSSGGVANVVNWPAAVGGGTRGGNWEYGIAHSTISYRSGASNTHSDRRSNSGWRGVRSAP
jgi:hypothetical protein